MTNYENFIYNYINDDGNGDIKDNVDNVVNENDINKVLKKVKEYTKYELFTFDDLVNYLISINVYINKLEESNKFYFINGWIDTCFNMTTFNMVLLKLDRITELIVDIITDPVLLLYIIYQKYPNLDTIFLDDNIGVKFKTKISNNIFETLYTISKYVNYKKYIDIELQLKNNGIIDMRWNGRYLVPESYEYILETIKDKQRCKLLLLEYSDYLLDNPDLFKKILASGYLIYDNTYNEKEPKVIENIYEIIGKLLNRLSVHINNNKICEIIQSWKVTDIFDYNCERDLLYVTNINIINDVYDVKQLGNMDPIIYLYRFYKKYSQLSKYKYEKWRPLKLFEDLIRPKIHKYLSMIKNVINDEEYQNLVDTLFLRRIIKSETNIILPNNISPIYLNSIINTLCINNFENVVQYLLINMEIFESLYPIIDEELIINIFPYMSEQQIALIVMSNDRELNCYILLDPLVYILSICREFENKKINDIYIDKNIISDDFESKHELLMRACQYIPIDIHRKLAKGLNLF